MLSLTITLIQPDLRWEDKKSNFELLSKKIEGIREKTEVVILPEMFSTGFSMQPEKFAEKMDGDSIEWMKKMAASKKIILTGSLIIEENGKYFNRLIWMLPDGNYGYYNKRHLFAFGKEDQYYSAGKKRLIASAKGWKINLQVCYDLRFPLWARQSQDISKTDETATQLEYDLLIYVANWPAKRNTAWKSLLQARAIENQCYVVGVNRVGEDGNKIYHSGDSMIIDPLGEILYHKENAEDVFTYTLQKQLLDDVREKFPFWKDADPFQIY
ncbi:MAG: amidohydrolase [Chitinophagaceae bacterium]|nr:amidohydrolase [Chitinophagaceae bacterium]